MVLVTNENFQLVYIHFAPLQKARVFMRLNPRNAYHLVRIPSGNERKTSFKTSIDYFKHEGRPFGLTAVFQSLINDVLLNMVNKVLFVFPDDFRIWQTQTHIYIYIYKHIQHVLLALRRASLLRSRRVSSTGPPWHSFGFIVKQGQLLTDPTNIQPVAEWPTLSESSSSSSWHLQIFEGDEDIDEAPLYSIPLLLDWGSRRSLNTLAVPSWPYSTVCGGSGRLGHGVECRE